MLCDVICIRGVWLVVFLGVFWLVRLKKQGLVKEKHLIVLQVSESPMKAEVISSEFPRLVQVWIL